MDSVQGLGFRAPGLRLSAKKLASRVQGLGLQVLRSSSRSRIKWFEVRAKLRHDVSSVASGREAAKVAAGLPKNQA